MKKYNVKITDTAFSDMEQIYDHIAIKLQAPDTALDQYNRIADAIESLDQMAERIKTVDFEPERSRGIRRLCVDNYSVFFFIHDLSVIVTNVMYSGSDVSARLKENNNL